MKAETPATSQARWAFKQKRRGRCRICGKRRNLYKWLCDFHGAAYNLYMKQYRAKRKAAKDAAKENPNVTQEHANGREQTQYERAGEDAGVQQSRSPIILHGEPGNDEAGN